jgi:predicted dehydrogenase/threonine dehydrogenase-like Zn-dependent dehydrogenase
MLQALIHKGSVKADEVPAPSAGKGRILIRVVNSCISAGTEMAGVSSTGKSPVRAMLEQPEKIKKILNLIKSEGLGKLLDQYKFIKKSGQPTGYSVSGIVADLGEDTGEFKIGDSVAAAGGGFAYHAEFVDVPKNLVVRMPSGVGYKEASTVAIGAIALHGVRRTESEMGEFCVVIGTGILGLLAIQMLSRSGVRVIAADIDKNRLEIASASGAEYTVNSTTEDPVKAVENITKGHGADSVLFSASTSDSKPLSQAFQMCRRKGKVILMGVSGMELNRKDMYPGEIDLHLSTSYGPGRYDKRYEEDGFDYPYSYVRWTEGRNFAEYLRLLATKQVLLEQLINKVYPIEEAEKAFESLKDTMNKPLMVLLDYGIPADISSVPAEKKLILNTHTPVKNNRINVGVIGIGSFAQAVHLPNLKALHDKYTIYALASQSGVRAKNAGTFYNARYITTQYDEIFADNAVDLVMICTRHGNHASLVLKALNAGKNVFVEKPLATNMVDLKMLEDFFQTHHDKAPLLTVGFNRRFSPYIAEIKKHTDNRIGPLFIHYRMNAGFQPADHWTHHDGGRIIGEACHIVDLMSALTNSRISHYCVDNIDTRNGKFMSDDNKTISLKYEDGSLATIEYISMGSRSMAKEYMEIHFDEKSIIMDDYRLLKSFGFRMNGLSSRRSRKGHLDELTILHEYLTNKKSGVPIELWDIFQTTQTTIALSEKP